MFDNTGWCATSEDPNALVGPLACVLPLLVLRCAYILSAPAHAPSAQAAQILGGVLFSTITLVDARDGAAFYIFWAPSPTSKTTANSFALSRRTSSSLCGAPSTPSPLETSLYGGPSGSEKRSGSESNPERERAGDIASVTTGYTTDK